MSSLQDLLTRQIARQGENSPAVQMLRNQIAAKKSGQSFQQMYLTGSYKRPAPKK